MQTDRRLATSERRVEKWLTPKVWGDLDRPAYRAMADQLIGVMATVGPAGAIEGLAALTKATALVLAAMSTSATNEMVAELCAGQAKTLEYEILSLRGAMNKGK